MTCGHLCAHTKKSSSAFFYQTLWNKKFPRRGKGWQCQGTFFFLLWSKLTPLPKDACFFARKSLGASYGGKINKLCSSKCRLDNYFQLWRINFNSCTIISSRFFVCKINFNSCTVISRRFFVCWKIVQLYNFSAHEKPTGNDCAGIKVNFAHEKPTGNNCAGIKVNSAQMEITV